MAMVDISWMASSWGLSCNYARQSLFIYKGMCLIYVESTEETIFIGRLIDRLLRNILTVKLSQPIITNSWILFRWKLLFEDACTCFIGLHKNRNSGFQSGFILQQNIKSEQ